MSRRREGLTKQEARQESRVIYLMLIIIAALIALALYGYLSGAWDSAQAESAAPLLPTQYERRLIDLDQEAIDAAYRTQIEHLFAIWMKDESGQPARAVKGARQARRAYIGAMAEIDRRRQVLPGGSK